MVDQRGVVMVEPGSPTPERLALLAWLDQESASLSAIWLQTDAVAQAQMIDWLMDDMPPDADVPAAWREFAARCAIATLQEIAARQ